MEVPFEYLPIKAFNRVSTILGDKEKIDSAINHFSVGTVGVKI